MYPRKFIKSVLIAGVVCMVFVSCIVRNSHVCQMHGKESTAPRGDMDAASGVGIWEKVMCSEEVQVHRHLTPASNRSSLATVSMSSTLTLEEGPKPMDGSFSDGEERF